MDTLIETYCVVDDFCKEFLPKLEATLLTHENKKRQRNCRLSIAEVMTIMIVFHQSNYRTFKHFYLQMVIPHLKTYFPKLVSYNRFVELMRKSSVPLFFFIHSQIKTETGIYFIDSTKISVCHVKRANSNKVFRHCAKKSKSTIGWYFGFKLHLLINDKGEIMSFQLTQSTVDDRKPVKKMVNGLSGIVIGDKGYLSQPLFNELYKEGLKILTKIKKNMKNKLMPMREKILLRRRAIIESVNDQLKNISQIEHSRHRSVHNFVVNLLSGLAAYTLQPKKPSLNIDDGLSLCN